MVQISCFRKISMSKRLRDTIEARKRFADSDEGHASIRASIVNTINNYIKYTFATQAEILLDAYLIDSLSTNSLYIAKEIVNVGIKIWGEHDNAEGPLATCEKLLLRTIHEFTCGHLVADEGIPHTDTFWVRDTELFQFDPLAIWLSDETASAEDAGAAGESGWRTRFGDCLTSAAQAYCNTRHRHNEHEQVSHSPTEETVTDLQVHRVIITALKDGVSYMTAEVTSVVGLPTRITGLSPMKLLVLLSSDYSDIKQAAKTDFSSACMRSARDRLSRDITAADLLQAGVMDYIRRKKRSGPPEDWFTPEFLLSVMHAW